MLSLYRQPAVSGIITVFKEDTYTERYSQKIKTNLFYPLLIYTIMIAITLLILLVTILTILAVNVYLRNKKGKSTDTEAEEDYFTSKRFLLYARCISVVLVTLFLIGITGDLYTADNPHENFGWIVFGVVATFYITLPIASLYTYSFVCSITRKTPYDRVLLCFHILGILLVGAICYILLKGTPVL